ncbi:antitoxin MazE family protein [Rhizobium sp. TRM95111]|nr:antitoxin MazE family protein [Rhizobium alarense]
MLTPVIKWFQRCRDAVRAAGSPPLQIWVTDTSRPGFANECRRQARLVAAADTGDCDLDGFIVAALGDLDHESGARFIAIE